MSYVSNYDTTIYVDQSDRETTSMYRVSVVSHPRELKDFEIGPDSLDRGWTASALAHGTTMVLKDFGDGVRVVVTPMNGEKKIIEFDYEEIVQLQMLVDAYQRTQDFPLRFDRFKPLGDDE